MVKEAGYASDLIERIKHEPGVARNVASLVVLMVFALVAGSYILTHQRFTAFWQKDTLVWASFKEAPSVAPGHGQEVRIAGVPVGEIRADRLGRRGDAELLLAIDKSKYGKPIYENATVVLRPKSPLNEMYININPGGPPAQPVAQNGVLAMGNTRAPVPIDESLSHLDDKTRAALGDLLSASDVALAHAPEDLPPGLRATERLLRDLRPVVEQLDTRRAKIATLMTSLSEISGAVGGDDERLARLADSLQTTLGTLSRRNGELRSSFDRLPGFMDSLRSATDSVTGLSTQLNPTLKNVREASDTLPDSLDAFTDTEKKLHETLTHARPVAAKLEPVVGDLRDFTEDLNRSLVDARQITDRLDHVTGGTIPYLTDLRAFVYQTNSVMSLKDANGGIVRGLMQVGPATIPGVSAPSPR
jgi:phospholipid/cholesterol/gamma-HCH transport system substrate-binding protein